MADQKHLEILKQGIEVLNTWRTEHPREQLDLSGADLRGLNLSYADLSIANLSGANLCKAYLQHADFSFANLNHADLSQISASALPSYDGSVKFIEAKLRNVKFRSAILENPIFCGADLSGADFSQAYLEWADFTGARLTKVIFNKTAFGANVLHGCDFSSCIGLDSINHISDESSVNIDTLFSTIRNLGGQLTPHHKLFFNEIGVPEILLDYLPSIVQSSPIQFYKCFISHSSKDKSFCNRLCTDLKAKGVRVWYFSEDAIWGKNIWGEIDRSIRSYDKLLLICSANSLNSVPVLREIERALNREDKEGKNILFPIRIDNYLYDSWEHERKADILSKVVGDFRGWKRNSAKYNTALEKLLNALKA